jgi:hypothetical protein
MKVFQHWVVLNLTTLLLIAAYVVLSAAAMYAFFYAFGWWCLAFAALAVFAIWVTTHWLMSLIFGSIPKD